VRHAARSGSARRGGPVDLGPPRGAGPLCPAGIRRVMVPSAAIPGWREPLTAVGPAAAALAERLPTGGPSGGALILPDGALAVRSEGRIPKCVDATAAGR
jgi:hypothetical protein